LDGSPGPRVHVECANAHTREGLLMHWSSSRTETDSLGLGCKKTIHPKRAKRPTVLERTVDLWDLGVGRRASRSGFGCDVAGALEWLDLCSHVVLEHITRDVHQRVAEIDIDAHAGEARVVVVLQARFFFGVVGG
jgi:hypothetical protein